MPLQRQFCGASAVVARGSYKLEVYTYLNPQTGHEFSGVLGFTYNFTNQSTQYQNGVHMHFDWGASQFLTKQFQVSPYGGTHLRVDYAKRRFGCPYVGSYYGSYYAARYYYDYRSPYYW